MKNFNGKAIYNNSCMRKTKHSERVKSNGYYAVYLPEHPFAFGKGYVYEHRYLIEQQIGRHLLPSEIVHHKDGNKLNNSIDNLELCASIAEHKAEHRRENSKVIQMPNEGNTLIKCACGCGNEFLRFDKLGRQRKYFTNGCPMRHKKQLKQEFIYCACECGRMIEKYDKHGRVRLFISGHNSGGIPNRTLLANATGLSFATIVNYFRGNKLRNKTVELINNSIINHYGEDYIRKQG